MNTNGHKYSNKNEGRYPQLHTKRKTQKSNPPADGFTVTAGGFAQTAIFPGAELRGHIAAVAEAPPGRALSDDFSGVSGVSAPSSGAGADDTVHASAAEVRVFAQDERRRMKSTGSTARQPCTSGIVNVS